MQLKDCIACRRPVGPTEAWEDEHGVLHFDLHLTCALQSSTARGLAIALAREDIGSVSG